jgi:hypothetical protein
VLLLLLLRLHRSFVGHLPSFFFLFLDPKHRQSSCLQIQRSGFDSRRYQIFWEVVGLEWDPLCLVSTSEELLGRKSSHSGLESRDYGRRDPSRWPRGTLYPQKLTLTSPTSGGRSVSIVRERPQATEFFLGRMADFGRWISVLQWSDAGRRA